MMCHFFMRRKKHLLNQSEELFQVLKEKLLQTIQKKLLFLGKPAFTQKLRYFQLRKSHFWREDVYNPSGVLGRKKKHKTRQSFDRIPQNLIQLALFPAGVCLFFSKKQKKRGITRQHLNEGEVMLKFCLRRLTQIMFLFRKISFVHTECMDVAVQHFQKKGCSLHQNLSLEKKSFF